MKKIPTIFLRYYDERGRGVLTQERNPECDWVFAGEGVATRKYDGACCAVIDGVLRKRREVKPGGVVPDAFVEVHFDFITGKRVGWLPVDPASAEDKYFMEAFYVGVPNGTYELVGPKVQGNPENLAAHTLIKHSDAEVYLDCPRDFDGLRMWLGQLDIEGVVFHHPDGRMAKIKKRDFNLKR